MRHELQLPPGLTDLIRRQDRVVHRDQAYRAGLDAADISQFWRISNMSPPASIHVVVPHERRLGSPHPRIVVIRRRGPDQAVGWRRGIRAHAAPRALLDVLAGGDIEALDEALRRRWTSLAELRSLHERLGPRPGSAPVGRLLVVAENAWSAAERELHRLLRAAGVSGWRANAPVQIGSTSFALDVAFYELRLAIEVDGLAFHSDRRAFHGDRARQNQLVAAGWTVLRFTWQQLQDDPAGVIATIRHTIDLPQRRSAG